MGVSKSSNRLPNIVDAYIEACNGNYVIRVKEKNGDDFSLKYVDFCDYDSINTYHNHEVLYSQSFFKTKVEAGRHLNKIKNRMVPSVLAQLKVSNKVNNVVYPVTITKEDRYRVLAAHWFISFLLMFIRLK